VAPGLPGAVWARVIDRLWFALEIRSICWRGPCTESDA